MRHLALSAMAASAAMFAVEAAGENDFLKVLDTINKVVDTVQDAGATGVQVSTGFSSGAATGVGTVFPTGTKTIYVSYTASGASTSLPIQAVWYQVKNGQSAKIYTLTSKMPKSGTVGEFHLGRQDSSWPVGDYKVDLVAQGRTLATATFKIGDSESSGNEGVWGGTATVQAPGVKDVVAATGFSSGKAVGSAASFQQNIKTVYIVYTAVGQSSGVNVQAVWQKVDSFGTAAKISAMNATLPESGALGEFHLSVSGASWPAGSYKVDLLIDGATAGSVSFKVEEQSNAGVWQTTTETPAATTTPATTSSSSSTTTKTTSGAAQKALDDFFGK